MIVTAAARRAMSKARPMTASLYQMDQLEDETEELDADEGRDEPSQAVDEQRAPQERRRPEGPVAHAAERQRDQQDDDDRVEDDGRQDRALRRRQAHDVQRRDVREHGH